MNTVNSSVCFQLCNLFSMSTNYLIKATLAYTTFIPKGIAMSDIYGMTVDTFIDFGEHHCKTPNLAVNHCLISDCRSLGQLEYCGKRLKPNLRPDFNQISNIYLIRIVYRFGM